MPIRPPMPGVVKIELNYTLLGEGVLMANVLHASYDTAPTQAQLDAAAHNVYTEWVATAFSNCVDAVELSSVVLTDLASDSAPQSTWVGTSQGGDSAHTCSDSARSLVVTIRTAFRSRSGRGRIFMPPMGDAHVDGLRHYTTEFAAALALAVATFATNIATATTEDTVALQLGVLSYFGAGAPRSVPLFSPATSYTADTRIDHQRRRAGKH